MIVVKYGHDKLGIGKLDQNIEISISLSEEHFLGASEHFETVETLSSTF